MTPMKRHSYFTASLLLGSFLVMASACKNQVQKESPTVEALDVNAAENFQVASDSSDAAVGQIRAGLGCTGDQDQAALDPDAKVNDVETKQIKTTRGQDVVTSLSTLTVVKTTSNVLFLNKHLMSYSSKKAGELLETPVDSAFACDVEQPLNKTCGKDQELNANQMAAMKKSLNSNGLMIFREGHAASNCSVKPAVDVVVSQKDELGTYQMQNGQKISALRHVKTTTGHIACQGGNVGHGTIREEVISSRDAVAVGELLVCGGVQVVTGKTVTLDRDNTIDDDDPRTIQKVIYSQRTEILDTKLKQGEQK